MDEFKSHSEKEFWERVLIASSSAGVDVIGSIDAADLAVSARRIRMAEIAKPPGVKAA